jgi:ATP-dependent exoDNAse (exonuclease V) beta subunit
VWSKKSLRPLLPESLQKAFEDTISRQVAESLCVSYVAVTRAKHAMHLLCSPIMSDKPPKSYAGLLLAALSGGNQAPPSTTLYETGDPEWFTGLPDLRFAEAQPRTMVKAIIPQVRLSPMPDGRRRGLRRRAPSRHDETRLYLPEVTSAIAKRQLPEKPVAVHRKGPPAVDARTRGTVMHAWFECIDWLDGSAAMPDEALLRTQSMELSVPDNIVNLLLPDFMKMLKQPEIRKAFECTTGGGAPSFDVHKSQLASGQLQLKVERERTFVLLHNGELVQGTIDRLVLLYSNGRPVAADVVDFKTDRFVGDRTRWIEGKQLHYGPQLAEYRFAVSHCFGIPSENISTRLLLLEAQAVVAT